MGLIVTTPPTVWPVLLAEAKQHLRVSASDEDAQIGVLIKSAVRHIENTLGRTLAVQSYRLTLDAFADAIELPRGPVASVESVKYIDVNGAEQTIPTSVYTVDVVSRKQWVVLNAGETWPETLDAINVVTVDYTAGDTPEDLFHAVLFLIGHFYLNREAATERGGQELPLAVDSLLLPYRDVWIGA